MSVLVKIFTALKNFLWRRKWLLLLLLVLGGGVFFFVRSKQLASQDLNFARVERKELVKYLEVSGVIDAKQKADLYFATGGKLVYLGAQEGEAVRRGQTIATIDRAALSKQLEQSLNLYESQRAAHEELGSDYSDRVITSKEELNRFQEQQVLENSVIAVELNSIAIRNTVLAAPFDGILTVAPQVVPGVQLAPTDYFEVVDPNSLILRASLDETDLPLVRLGQPALISLDAYDAESFASQVNYISYVSRETVTGTVFTVEFPLPVNSLERYRIGLNAEARIELERRADVLAVPVEAVRQSDGRYLVDVKANNAAGFETRTIEIGLETEDEMEVLSGLSEGEEVVLPK